MYQPRKAQPTIVYTPLPSDKEGKGEGAPQHNDERRRISNAGSPKAVTDDPYRRAENEDDDGYDPYSDRREEPPLFEENPWD